MVENRDNVAHADRVGRVEQDATVASADAAAPIAEEVADVCTGGHCVCGPAAVTRGWQVALSLDGGGARPEPHTGAVRDLKVFTFNIPERLHGTIAGGRRGCTSRWGWSWRQGGPSGSFGGVVARAKVKAGRKSKVIHTHCQRDAALPSEDSAPTIAKEVRLADLHGRVVTLCVARHPIEATAFVRASAEPESVPGCYHDAATFGAPHWPDGALARPR
eukprot:CAMPEP_0182925436 /NCGR_PEP_ID=MMETSP0105_2-20130417/9411_1 /TAXON_ID=81532 ORGANISM="Acanthoeca-like sp., Strain 10tr" /NCGR_SAMPLE_ID=MMETSP0105_2 /ASSEMBLY_ACC=CAM_ASM_000205 /LENGTH=217 /DNA_ID=CAMNT_0025063285 /DNA_START=1592 /DNA_END=2246 /DNA_ORIENTATION=+